jgi:hypothetical protein
MADEKRPRGALKGNTNGVQSGVYSLLAIRVREGNRPNGNTSLGRQFRAIEREYYADLGGEENLSRAERQMVGDTVWCDFMNAAIDANLSTKKTLTRKGKAHPLIDLRIKVAAHRRENYKLLGLKRVPKQVSWEETLREIKAEVPPQPESSQDGESQNVDSNGNANGENT